MSASREKKLRQDAGPSPWEAEAQQKSAAYRRKAITYTVIGVVVVILVAALLIWNSGFLTQFKAAAKVGDTSYSISDMSYFWQQAKYNSNYFYYAYGMTDYIPADTDVQDSETGKTWHDYYLDQALESMKKITALYDDAVKNGWSDKDVADEVDEEIASFKSSASSAGYGYSAYLKAIYGKYMTAGNFKSLLTRVLIANNYSTEHQDSLTYSNEALSAYYEENRDTLDTFDYSYLYFTPAAVETTDANGNELDEATVADLEAEALSGAKALADEALAAFKGGKDADAVIDEYGATASSGENTTALGSDLTYNAYYEELCGMSEGEAALVENGESGYYVIVLHSRYRDETPNADVRHILIMAETTTDDDGNTVAATDEAWEAARVKAQQVLDEYKAGAQTEEAFTELARKYSEDVDSDGNPNNDALYSNISPHDGYVSEFLDWIFQEGGHSVGDTGIVEHNGGTSGYSGCHIMYYAGDNVPYWKSSSESALRSSDTSDWLEELQSGYSASLESGSDYV